MIFCVCVMSSWDTCLLSFFTFPVCFKCWTTVGWLTLSFWENSHVVVRGSALMILSIQFSIVQLLNRVRLAVTPWTAAWQASLSNTSSQSLLKLMSIEMVMLSNHLILYHPLLLLPSIFPSIRVFSNESVLHIKWPKYWSFSFTITPSSVYSGLISFWIDWLDLLAVQETLKSLLQHHSSEASILKRSNPISWSLSTSDGWPLCSSSSRLLSSLQSFLSHHCIVCSLAVPGPNAVLVLWFVFCMTQVELV